MATIESVRAVAPASPSTAPAVPAAYLDPVDGDNIPAWLRDVPHWVVAVIEPAPSGTGWRWTKPLVRGFGEWPPRAAKTNDPATWTDYETAWATYAAHRGESFRLPRHDRDATVTGLGIVLTPDLGIVGIDLDHAAGDDGTPLPWAKPFIDALTGAGAYIERSPSGTGYHAYVAGTARAAAKGNNVELYTGGRYLTVTGHAVANAGAPLASGAAVDACLSSLWAYAKGRDATGPKAAAQPLAEKDALARRPRNVRAAALSDNDLLARMCQDKANGATAVQLYYHGHPAGSDESANDMTLCNIVAYWFGPDVERIDRIMRQAAIMRAPGRLEKWNTVHRPADGATYGRMTIEAAVSTMQRTPYLAWLAAKQSPDSTGTIDLAGGLDAAADAALGKTLEEKADARLRGKLEPSLPVIKCSGGSLPQNVSEVERALHNDLYVWGNVVVQLLPTPVDYRTARKQDKRHRPAGLMTAVPVDVPALIRLAGRRTQWAKWSERRREWQLCNPQSDVMACVLANDGSWTFRTLSGIASLPLFMPTERGYFVLNESGYDDTTGIYLDFDRAAFPALDALYKLIDRELAAAYDDVREDIERQVDDMVANSIGVLSDALSEFPFVGMVDRAVAFAALLGTVMRPVLDNAPLVAITAPTPGTGKSMLAELVSIMATGRTGLNTVEYTADEAELGKRVFATLMETAPVTVIDNVPDGAVMHSATLDLVLTQPRYRNRILGQSRTATVSTCTQWIATGNNLTLAKDSTRRALLCRLDRQEERPQDHAFGRDLQAWAVEHRGDLVSAAIAVLGAYACAGRPKPTGLRPLASYSEWSDWVRGATIWALSGRCGNLDAVDWQALDPVASQRNIEADDPERDALAAVMAAWGAAFGTDAATTDKAMKGDPGNFNDAGPDNPRQALKDALNDAVPHRGGIDVSTRAVGKYLKRNAGKIIGGRKFVQAGSEHGKSLWQLVFQR